MPVLGAVAALLRSRSGQDIEDDFLPWLAAPRPRLNDGCSKHFQRAQKNSPCNIGLSADAGRTGPITVVGAIGGMRAHRREESLQVMRGFLRNQTINCGVLYN